MNKLFIIALTAIAFLGAIAAVEAVDELEIRGSVASVTTGTASWNADTFAGFYYDLQDDIKTEIITMDITQGNELAEDTGVTYATTAQADDFDFEDWGQFDVVGFLGEKYFAGYVSGFLYYMTWDISLLNDNQLSKILIDDDILRTMTTATPLKLEEGYELVIKTIDLDGNKVYIELLKDGTAVDDAVVEPSKYGATNSDKTYIYKKDLGDTSGIVLIAVHFKNAFRGAEVDLATIDGIFQISDVTLSIEDEDKYGRMEIDNVEAGKITMINSNKITLSKNKDLALMGDINVKTADSDDVPNRFYIYKEITEPGTYGVRGSVQNVWTSTVAWDANSFAGFYCDLDDNLKTETLTFDITQGNELAEDTGATYVTSAHADEFEFGYWGTFDVISFSGDLYFAGYIDSKYGTSSEILDEASSSNILECGQLSKILIDDGEERIIASGETIYLEDGYLLKLTAGNDEQGILVELLYEGSVIDRAAIIPPDTYVYVANVGGIEGVPMIAAHFEEPIHLEKNSYCKVDGIFQISDATLSVEEEDKYGKMEVDNVEDGKIAMINSNKITLSKNKDIQLLDDIRIKTADSDDVPNRFYIYKPVEIQMPQVI